MENKKKENTQPLGTSPFPRTLPKGKKKKGLEFLLALCASKNSRILFLPAPQGAVPGVG
jgi:hypothetical protein